MQWSAILLICVSIVTVQYCSARLSERRLLDELILRRLEEIGEERRRLVNVNPGAIMPSINLGGFIGRDTFDEYNLGQWMGYKNLCIWGLEELPWGNANGNTKQRLKWCKTQNECVSVIKRGSECCGGSDNKHYTGTRCSPTHLACGPKTSRRTSKQRQMWNKKVKECGGPRRL